MSIKAILTTLILGSSSMALAAPTATVNVNSGMVVRDHRPIDVDGAWFRNHRRPRPQPKPPVKLYANASYTYAPSYPVYEQPVYQAPIMQSMTLLAPTQLTARFDLNVTGELGGMSKVRLDATGCEGLTFIDKVTIYYQNGNYEQVDVGRNLSASSPIFDLGLSNGAAATRVIVDGQSMAGGSLAIFAL
jgi:hypothetical protein